ncbi:hypothetical protein G6O69_13380 [Pseudenhygromyxa sp. WMMC2535]|uniref:RHS repeat-associated core domain-containing protein n=1 Tax=Pseudenhygromyxa sp. WMMC2535 TaxID=2712867 RepID=UPI001553849F|nr:hypothetical protein [Pseudenhygromyxa sp. WMMC2535]
MPRAAHDERGELVWLADFDVLGRARSFALGRSQRVPFRFLGQLEDPELGIYYNIKRWYDPDLGAYLSPDPIGLAGGLHAWNFVGHPFDQVDPFGLEGTHWVYGLYDPHPPDVGQKPYYVGITTQDLRTREAQHASDGRVSKTAGIEALEETKVSETTARGYEQAYIEKYETKTAKPGDPWGNKGNPLEGEARGNRKNSYVKNNTRASTRFEDFEKAKTAKLKQLDKTCS